MKSTFTAKYLQHLNKKNGNKGFTLIELLVVIIIVGVLAAIALPSFLSQIGKARSSEAKANLGTVNRSQQAYRLENSAMATTMSLLDAKISGKFYTYAVVAGAGVNNAQATAVNNGNVTDIKHLRSAVLFTAANGTTAEYFGQIVCESERDATDVAAITGVPAAQGERGTCPAASQRRD